MPRGGSKPGERRGGRKKGDPNRATIEQAIKAEQAVVTAKAAGRKLAKEELEDIVPILKGAASYFQPLTPEMIAAGAQPNPDKAWPEFERWLRLLIECLAKLAPYQSPTFRAIMVAPAPDANQPAQRKRFSLTVFEGGRPAQTIDVEPTPIKKAR